MLVLGVQNNCNILNTFFACSRGLIENNVELLRGKKRSYFFKTGDVELLSTLSRSFFSCEINLKKFYGNI